jgi:hypothetical protein
LFFDERALGLLQDLWEGGAVHQGVKNGRIHGGSLDAKRLARKWGREGRTATFLTGLTRFRD